MKKLLIISLGVFLSTGLYAQEILTLDNAFKMALENNLDIKIEQENLNISANQATFGNAGYYPDVAINGSLEQSLLNSDADYDFSFTGGEGVTNIGGDGLTTTTYQVGIGFDQKIFEGFAKKYRYRQLVGQKDISTLQLQNQVERTIIDVAKAYLDIARYQAALDLAEENMLISKERANRSEINAKYGSGTNLGFLQSMTFLNNDSIEYRNTEVKLKNSKHHLNQILGRIPETQYTVDQDVVLMPKFSLETLTAKTLENNTFIKISHEQLKLTQLNLSLAKSTYSPTISLSGSYGYFRQENEKNLIVYQENLGFTGGITLSIPIFTGNMRKSQVQSSKITVEKYQYSIVKTKNEVQTELLKVYEQYQFFLEQLSIEEKNLSLYERTFKKATEDFVNGLTNSTEVRDTQTNLSAAKNRTYSLRYSVRLYELMLQQIAGELVQSI